MQNVLIVASEAAPFVNTSGVASVVMELCLQLRRDNCDARLAIPYYRSLRFETQPRTIIPQIEVPMGPASLRAAIKRVDYRIEEDSEQQVPVYLISDPFYFDRENIYGYTDDYERFVCFTRTTLEMISHPDFRSEGWLPNVLHGHDWIAGLFPLWLRDLPADDPRHHLAFVYTIHNAGFPGQFSSRSAVVSGLAHHGVFACLGESERTINFMARGIIAADAVSTVSPQHARELQSGEYAPYLRAALASRREEIVGILNGVDETLYSPYLDRSLHRKFGPQNIAARKDNKAFLQKSLGLRENPDTPLFGIVSRLIAEKGLGLVEEVLPALLAAEEAQFVLLGQAGDFHFREAFANIEAKFPNGMAVRFAYDETLARQIFAGSDVILKPSLREPCGLQQMLAMRYGALPLVRKTGGLADSVIDWQSPEGDRPVGRGFVFEEFSAVALRQAIREAATLYRSNRPKWRDLQNRNMKLDLSWAHPTSKYLALYESAIRASRSRPQLPDADPLGENRDELLLQMILTANELTDASSTPEYLRHIADASRELLDYDGLLIWTVDDAKPQFLRLVVGSPAGVISSEEVLEEQSERTWSQQYVFHLESDEKGITALQAQLGFLGSRVAKQNGWLSQLTVPISAGGAIRGRIDAFSTTPKREFHAAEIGALTAVATTIGVNLERRFQQQRHDRVLELDRNLAQARTVLESATSVLTHLAEATSAERVTLKLPNHRRFEYDGDVVEEKFSGAVRDDPRASYLRAYAEWGDRGDRCEITIQRGISGVFSKEHGSELRTVAAQAAPALEAMLRREEAERSRVSQLQQLAESLVGGGDFEQLLQSVTTTMAEVLQADAASLYLVNEETDRLEIRAAYGYHAPLLATEASYARGEGTTGWLWEKGEKFKADSLDELHRVQTWTGKYKALQNNKEPRAFMGYPMKIADRFRHDAKVIGVFKIEDRRPLPPDSRLVFTAEEFLLGEMMANIIATAVHNAQASGAQFRKLSNDLGKLSSALAGGQDIQGLVEGVVKRMAETLSAGASSLYLLNESRGLLEIRAATGYQAPLVAQKVTYLPGEGITGWIYQKGEIVRANDLGALHAHPSHKGKFNSQQQLREPKSFLGLPLKVTDRFTRQPKVIGVLKVEEIEETPAHPESYFTAQDELLVSMMANVIATVVYNAQVGVAGMQKLTDDLDRLSLTLAGGKDLNALVGEVVETTARVLGAEASSLYLYDDARRVLVIKAATGYQKELVSRKAEYEPGEGITGWIFQKGRHVRANSLQELREHPTWKGKQNNRQGNKEPDTFLGVPLKIKERFSEKERVIGVLKVEEIIPSASHPGEVFTDQDVALVTMMASVIAAVVFNTQVGEEQLKRFTTNLEDLSKVLASGQDMSALVDKVVETIADVLGAEASSLYLYDEATGHLVIQAAMGYQKPLKERRASYKPGEGVTGYIFQTGESFKADTLAELRAHKAWKGAQNPRQQGREPNSFLGVPLRVGDRKIGVLKVENIRSAPNHPEERFTDQDVLLVTMMANVIATVVSNSRGGEARVGEILRQLGVLSAPVDASSRLLSEFSQRTDEGLVDQMAIVWSAFLDREPAKHDSEAAALYGVRANKELFRRIAERAKNPEIKYVFGVYYDVLTGFPQLKTWQEVRYRAQPWFRLRADNNLHQQFQTTSEEIVRSLVSATRLAVESPFLGASKWHCFVVLTASSFGENVRRILIAIHQDGRLDADRGARLLFEIEGRLQSACQVVQVVTWDEAPLPDEIRQLKSALKSGAQELVITSRSDLIRILASTHPLNEYRSLVFHQASAPLLFVTNGSVPDYMFFGRSRELAGIMEQICSDRSCVLIGGRMFGKTSILDRLGRTDLPNEGYTAAYADVRWMTTESDFQDEEILKWYPTAPPNAPATLGDLLAHPPPKMVLLLDEPDQLIREDARQGWRLFNKLRARVNEGSLRVVLSGERFLRLAVEDEQTGPLKNLGEKILLAPLDFKAVEALVGDSFRFIEVELLNGPHLIQQIYEFAGGHPCVTQRICRRLVEDLNRKESTDGFPRQVAAKDLERILSNVEFLNEDYLKVIWERATALEIVVSLLMARQPNLQRISDIHTEVLKHCGSGWSAGNVEQAVMDLIRLRSILRRTEGGFEFALKSYPEVVSKDFAEDSLYIYADKCRAERGGGTYEPIG